MSLRQKALRSIPQQYYACKHLACLGRLDNCAFARTRKIAFFRAGRSLVPRFLNTTAFVASIFGSGEARRGSIPRSGAVTEEQRRQNRKATQPFGRRFFLARMSLLAPYRPLKGMCVARASSGPKIPRRKRGCIYEMGYLGCLGMNPVALITGASRGIGRGIALELAAIGYDLLINFARDAGAAGRTAADCA